MLYLRGIDTDSVILLDAFPVGAANVMLYLRGIDTYQSEHHRILPKAVLPSVMLYLRGIDTNSRQFEKTYIAVTCDALPKRN